MIEKKKYIEEMVPDLEKKHFARYEIQNEIIAAKRVKIPGKMFDRVGVFSSPLVKSKEDLEVYVKRARERLDSLPDDHENINATITFRKPQPESIIKDIISKHHINGFGVKIEGSHGFKTMTRYPIDKDFIKEAKKGIIETYHKNKELIKNISDPEKRKIAEQSLPGDFEELFEINRGIFALYCVGNSSNLKKCKTEEEIYVMDIGPVEVRDQLLQLETNLPRDVVVTQPGDLAYFVRKFLS
ncbi:hypothetical protein LCGC14_1924470 [marine sediment metagenome]|uniref:Uncharacterized protein n=1 Tax=marine sediment metagenome TaxID=412755 RepID=A0A0F9I3P4_9ZZZZ